VYGYPKDDAAIVAVDTIRSTPTTVDEVVLCAFDEADRRRYQDLLERDHSA
jgi:O-acetyl-ADP-ribose deacetylase (regulator of RNase III)